MDDLLLSLDRTCPHPVSLPGERLCNSGLIVAQKAVVASLESQKDDRDQETMQIFDGQQRLRESMKSLKGSPEEKKLLERYTQQLNEQESRLLTQRKQTQQLEIQQQAAQQGLDKMIGELSLAVKL